MKIAHLCTLVLAAAVSSTFANPLPIWTTTSTDGGKLAEMVPTLVSDPAHIIPNQYIVVFSETATDAAIAEHHAWLSSFVVSNVQVKKKKNKCGD